MPVDFRSAVLLDSDGEVETERKLEKVTGGGRGPEIVGGTSSGPSEGRSVEVDCWGVSSISWDTGTGSAG